MKTFQITLLVFGIFIAVGLYIIIQNRHKESRQEFRNIFISVVSLVITLFGIVLAIVDDYLSQYGYNKQTIRNYEIIKKEGTLYDDCLNKGEDEELLEFVFVLDVSGSAKGNRVKLTPTIQKQIELIYRSGLFLGIQLKTFDVDDRGTIPFYELLKVRLLYSLLQLKNLDRYHIEYSIICYSDPCYIFRSQSYSSLEEILLKSFEFVDNMKFNGMVADIDELFSFMNDQTYRSIRNPFERKDAVIVFLTEMLHTANNTLNCDALEPYIKRLYCENYNVPIN